MKHKLTKEKAVVLGVEVVEVAETDTSMQKLDRRFQLAKIPIIGRWLSRGGYTTRYKQ